MNIYEDEEETADTSVLGFIRKNKQLVIMAVSFVLFYGFTTFLSRGLDEAVAAQQSEKAEQHSNPWAKDK
ncbi:MAG: hypothetical protein ACKOOL_02285 [Novosphingobium sp.]